MRRFALYLAIGIIGAVVFVGTADVCLSRDLRVGGDISALTVHETNGGIYTDRGAAGDAIAIMAKRGCNTFRLRLFVDPNGFGIVVNDLAYTIALATRIKAAGAKLLLDFHYSDTWADPAHQSKPAAWAALDFDSLEQTVRLYTRDVLAAMMAADVGPELVQIGNEITGGFMWPDGKLWGVGEPTQQWNQFVRLLTAGIAGVSDAGSSARIVIHTHEGGNWGRTQWFVEQLGLSGVDFDVIALSFYPWWHGKLTDLENTIHNAAQTFDKDVLVVETAYPWKPFIDPNPAYLLGNLEHPTTPRGQQEFLAEVMRIVRDAPGGRGLGVLWWYPESIPSVGMFVWHGGVTALFDQNGQALPALSEFQERNPARTQKRPQRQ